MAVEIDIDIDEIKGLPRDVEIALSKAMKYLTMDLEAEAGKEAPVGETGQLMGRIGMGQKSKLAYYIGSDIVYRWWVHEGTGIHGVHEERITPVEKQLMVFRYDGRKVVTQSVEGQEPNPYYERAIETVEDNVDMYVEKAMEDLL